MFHLEGITILGECVLDFNNANACAVDQTSWLMCEHIQNKERYLYTGSGLDHEHSSVVAQDTSISHTWAVNLTKIEPNLS